MILLAFCFISNTRATAQQADPATALITEAIHTFFTYDAEAYGSYFIENAELINPMGMRFQGRAMINQMHERYFRSLVGQTGQVTVKQEKVSYLNPTTAVVTLHIDSKSTDAADKVVNTMSAVVMAVAQQDESGTWKIHQFQVTPVIPFDRPGQG